MANKRMIRRDVIDTDAFLDMPLSTQALYFHLNLRADDDGFVGNPSRITKFIGASEDDLKLLIAKNFVILFEKGVIVIKHWRMHNTLSASRYHETNFTDEKAMLRLKENKSYTLGDGQIIDDSRLLEMSERQSKSCRRTKDEQKTNSDIDKDIDKDIDIDIDKENIRKRVNYQEIVNLYNETCVSFPKLVSLSESRKKAIKARLHNYTIDDFRRMFEKTEASSFLKGKNGRNWSASFDWMIKDANFAKILEGNYDDRGAERVKTDQNGLQYDVEGNLLYNIDEAPEAPPFYSLPPQWFDQDNNLIREKVTPIKQRALIERGFNQPIIYPVNDILEKYDMLKEYFDNLKEETEG